MKVLHSLACLLVPAAAALAQTTPPSWRWHLDAPAENVIGRDPPAGGWQFQEMIPGMHLTSGPGVVVFPASDSAAGRFAIEATIVVFPNSTSGGYGIAFGGQSLGERGATWTAFQLSTDGRFRVVRRGASGDETIVQWTPSESILKPSAETATNVLRVSVEADSIRFVVNSKPVGSVPRSAVRPDGQFGLRFEPGVNTHVTNVDLTRRLLKRRP